MGLAGTHSLDFITGSRSFRLNDSLLLTSRCLRHRRVAVSLSTLSLECQKYMRPDFTRLHGVMLYGDHKLHLRRNAQW